MELAPSHTGSGATTIPGEMPCAAIKKKIHIVAVRCVKLEAPLTTIMCQGNKKYGQEARYRHAPRSVVTVDVNKNDTPDQVSRAMQTPQQSKAMQTTKHICNTESMAALGVAASRVRRKQPRRPFFVLESPINCSLKSLNSETSRKVSCDERKHKHDATPLPANVNRRREQPRSSPCINSQSWHDRHTTDTQETHKQAPETAANAKSDQSTCRLCIICSVTQSSTKYQTIVPKIVLRPRPLAICQRAKINAQNSHADQRMPSTQNRQKMNMIDKNMKDKPVSEHRPTTHLLRSIR